MSAELRSAIARIAELVRSDSNEDDVERLFQPVYEALGYTRPGHDIRGKRHGESGAPDVALLNSDRSFQAIFELKNPSEKLSAHRKQLIDYVRELKAPWGVLTNGRKLELYKRDGISIDRVDEFDILELAEEPTLLLALSKRTFNLEEFSVFEERFTAAIADPLSLRKLDSISSKIFLETFDLSEGSPFGKLIAATIQLFDDIDGRSAFQAGSFSFWKKFFARSLGTEDVPDRWRPFIPSITSAQLFKFMFVLETTYALVARLIVLDAVG